MQNSYGVIVLNLGSPDQPDEESVRLYLKEFLSDPYVMDMPSPLRWALLNFIILPKRPKRSAELYKSIWREEGSPLIYYTNSLTDKVKEHLLQESRPDQRWYVDAAMRYGNPSLSSAVDKLYSYGIERLYILPLYPHYAQATTLSSLHATLRAIDKHKGKHHIPVRFLKPFFKSKDYIRLMVEQIKRRIPETDPATHTLFSYHGIPVSHIKNKNFNSSCYNKQECCFNDSDLTGYCYKAQALHTTESLAKALNLTAGSYSSSFQSRLGQDRWLTPSTNDKLQELASKGVKRINVVAPSFTADCLETLEELAVRGRELFISKGGEKLTLIPALNDHSEWGAALAEWIQADLFYNNTTEGEHFIDLYDLQQILNVKQ